MKYKLFFITSLLFIFIFLLSCFRDYAPPMYGLEFNDVRINIGLPILNENWKYSSNKLGNYDFNKYDTANCILD